MDTVRLATLLFSSDSRPFPVRLWNGAELPPARDAGVRGTVVLRIPEALEAFLPPAAERRLAEAIIAGDIELEGDAIGLIEAGARWSGPRPAPALAVPVIAALARGALRSGLPGLEARFRGRLHTPGRDREAIR